LTGKYAAVGEDLLRSLWETQREKNKQFDEKENSIEERERQRAQTDSPRIGSENLEANVVF
jgi:hypothetical protein